MKIALASKEFKDNDLEFNFCQIKKAIEQLHDTVDLICFGEAFLHGFNALTWNYVIDKDIAVASNSSLILKIQSVVQKNKVAIAFGFFELYNDDIYCSYIVIDKRGKVLDIYRRISKGWKEYRKTNSFYKEGDRFKSFYLNDEKIISALCGDLWDNNNIKSINDETPDIVLWPLHLDYEIERWNKGEKQDYLVQASKIDAHVLMVNNISDTSYGGCYHFHKGKIIRSLETGQEGFLVVEI